MAVPTLASGVTDLVHALNRARLGLTLCRPDGPAAEVQAGLDEAGTALRAALGEVTKHWAGPGVERRRLLGLIAALDGVTVGSDDPGAAPIQAGGDAEQPDTSTFEGLLEVSRLAWHAYPHEPPAILFPVARELLSAGVAQADASLSPGQRRQGSWLIGQTAALSGWLAFDLDRYGEARAYFALARDAAREADDRVLLASALASLSLIYSTIPQGFTRGDPCAALRLMEQANATTTNAPAITRAWLAARLAEEQALAGDGAGCRDSLDRAQTALGEARPSQDGFFADSGFFHGWNSTRLAAYRGLSYRLLGKPSAAEDVLLLALADTPSTQKRERCLIAADVAGALLDRGETDLACDAALRALDDAESIGYALGLARLRGFQMQLRGHPSRPGARLLEERLASG